MEGFEFSRTFVKYNIIMPKWVWVTKSFYDFDLGAHGPTLLRLLRSCCERSDWLRTLQPRCVRSEKPGCPRSCLAAHTPALLRTLRPRCGCLCLTAYAPTSLRTLLTRCARSGLAAHALRNHKSTLPPLPLFGMIL